MEEAAATSRARKNINTASSARRTRTGEAIAFAPDSIQARLVKLRRSLPKREWSTVPRDGSVELDHYLYGAPKNK